MLNAKLKSRASWLVKLGMLSTCIFYFAYFVSFEEVISLIRVELFLAVLAVQSIFFVATCAVALRHSLLLGRGRATFGNCLKALLLSAGINLVTFGRISELVKLTYLRKNAGISLSTSSAALLVERLFDLLAVSVIGLIGVAGIFLENSYIPTLMAAIGGSGLLLVKPVAVYCHRLLGEKQGRLANFLCDTCLHIQTTLSRRNIVSVTGLTFFSWGSHFVGIWFFFFLLPDVSITWEQASLVFGAVIFAAAMPGLPAGIGVVQAAVTITLTSIGIDVDSAFTLSVALHVAEFLISALTAPVLLLTTSTGVGDLLSTVTKRRKETEA